MRVSSAKVRLFSFVTKLICIFSAQSTNGFAKICVR